MSPSGQALAVADGQTQASASAETRTPALAGDDIALIDLLDRLLCGGVVVAGDITLAIADIDLVYVSLRALISSVSPLER